MLRLAKTAIVMAGCFCLSTLASAQNESSPSDSLQRPAAADTLLPAPIAPLTQAPDSSSQAIQALVIQAMNSLDASKIPSLSDSKQRLLGTIARLENYIVPASSNGQAWGRFLGLESLKEEVEREFPSVDVLADLQANMRQNYPGLEYPPFVELRDAISQMVRALRYGYAPEKSIQVLNGKLKQLLDAMNQPATAGAGTERSYEIGLIANYLHEMNQAPAAVAGMHQRFGTPNVQIYARESLLNRVLMRPVSQPSPVNECLLGTRIIGQACLNGSVTVDVQPMFGGVSMNLNLAGNMTTNSRGYNRGVVIGSTASSPVYASKQIVVSPQGISSMPASVATNLQTSINSIDHRFRVVRRIAQKKAAEQKPQADSIAQGRLQRRIQTQYNDQVEQQLSKARVQLATFQGTPRPELTRLELSKPSLSVYSTASSVQGDLKQATSFQIAAEKPCGIAKPALSDIVIEAHQSALINALDVLVGDRTIRNTELDNFARQASLAVTEELKKEAEGEPWSITMTSFRPVEVEFDDQLARIKLRITKMSRGDQSLEDDVLVTATYLPSFNQGVLTLDRQGEVEVNFAKTSRGLRAVTLRAFLKGKFDAFFKERFVTERIDLRKSFPNAPSLAIDSIKLDDGWVQVGVR